MALLRLDLSDFRNLTAVKLGSLSRGVNFIYGDNGSGKTSFLEAIYYLNRGLVKERLNDPKGANEDYTIAIELKEDFDKAWFARANLCAKLNKFPEAIDDYTITIFHNPLFGAAHFNRALAYQHIGKTKEACDDLTKAEELGMTIPASVNSMCTK